MKENQNDYDLEIFKNDIISLLEGNKYRRAIRLLNKWKSKIDVPKDFRQNLRLYCNREILTDLANKTILESRRHLLSAIQKNLILPELISKILSNKITDFILISNSSQLKFTVEEESILKSLYKPCFVYHNYGNHRIIEKRKCIYNDRSLEIQFGGFKQSFDTSYKSFFDPYYENNFLGYIVTSRSHHYSDIVGTVGDRLDEVNKFVYFFSSKYLINDWYPVSFGPQGLSELRSLGMSSPMSTKIPTNGWISICLFDAISQFIGRKQCRLWTAGFDMSPSYAFGPGSQSLHNFAFEKRCLELRSDLGETQDIGVNDNTLINNSSKENLTESGNYRECLGQYFRRKNYFP